MIKLKLQNGSPVELEVHGEFYTFDEWTYDTTQGFIIPRLTPVIHPCLQDDRLGNPIPPTGKCVQSDLFWMLDDHKGERLDIENLDTQEVKSYIIYDANRFGRCDMDISKKGY